jgi:hypothetical protein
MIIIIIITIMEHECKGGLYRRELVGGRQGK